MHAYGLIRVNAKLYWMAILRERKKTTDIFERRWRIFLLVMCILTIFWLTASYVHVRAYNQMREDDIERLGEEIAELIDYYPVWIWGLGQLLLVIGILLAMAWIIIIFEMVKRVKKRITGGSKIMPLRVCGMIVMLIVTTLNLSFAVAEPIHACMQLIRDNDTIKSDLMRILLSLM